MTKENKSFLIGFILIFIIGPMILIYGGKALIGGIKNYQERKESKIFHLVATSSTKFYEDELLNFASKEGIELSIDYYEDLEIVDLLNSETNNYDGVWISNSIWLYMLDNSYLVTNSKSISLSPVVMGIKKSKAEELNLIRDDVTNKDILDNIKDGKLKYVMNSVTKTNAGASAYLNILTCLAGNPEVLKSEMLNDPKLIESLKEFFKGVGRVSGDEEYLQEMFKNSDYDAIINYENSLIELNNELVNSGKEPLYLIYPTDGVSINDMPFGYVNRNQNKEENFKKIQQFLRNNDSKKELQKNGLRTWFGGTTNEADSSVFKKEWGIDTTKYLINFKYPSKKVMNEAFELYVEALRKPTHTVFVLDMSGSMAYNEGLTSLKASMDYILDKEQAREELIQFSDSDKITIITFNGKVNNITDTYTGKDTKELIEFVNEIDAYGGTNIYDPSVEALKKLKDESEEFMKVVVLMTDGESNVGSYSTLQSYYKENNLNIPIYSITFGDSSEDQLRQIASLTNAKIFDGKSGLIEAFKEVRSYN